MRLTPATQHIGLLLADGLYLTLYLFDTGLELGWNVLVLLIALLLVKVG